MGRPRKYPVEPAPQPPGPITRRDYLKQHRPASAEANHSLFGLSLLHRRVLCPGSYWMEMALPDKQTDEAAEGELLHRHAQGPVGQRSEELTTEQNDLVEDARKFRDSMIPRDSWTQTEALYELRTDAGRLVTWGRLDFVAIPHDLEEGYAVVIDYKFGYDLLPERATTIQLGGYGAMIIKRTGVKRVLCAAYNPRRHEALKLWVSHAQESHIDGVPNIGVIKVISRIDETIQTCLDPYAALVPGEAQCKYCRGFAMCPAVNSELRDIELVPQMPTAEITPTILREIADRLALAKKWVKAAHAFLWDVGRGGMRIPGYEMKEVNGARGIDDARKAYQRISNHLTFDEFLRCMKASVTAMEEAYVREGQLREPGRSAKDLAAEFNLVMGDAIKREPSTWRLQRTKEHGDV